MPRIGNNFNIKVGDTQMLKVMCGDFQVWPEYIPPEPQPTVCVPASSGTTSPIRYASEIVPYGEYVLRWGSMYCKKGVTPTLSEGTTNVLIVVAVPKADIPALADEPLYLKTAPGNTGVTYYNGCAYALMNKDTGEYLSVGLNSSYWGNASDATDFFIDFFDPSLLADGYTLGERNVNQIDSTGWRLARQEENNRLLHVQNYYNQPLPNGKTLAGWENIRVDLVSASTITPTPYPTTCIPASAATANPIKHITEIVPYKNYALKCGNRWCNKIPNSSSLGYFDLTFHETTEKLLVLTAVPKWDIPEIADGTLYGHSSREIYEGCAYVFRDIETGQYLDASLAGARLVDIYLRIPILVDYLENDAEGYTAAFRSINQTDTNGRRLSCGNWYGRLYDYLYVNYQVGEYYGPDLDGRFPDNFSSAEEWDVEKVDFICTDYI